MTLLLFVYTKKSDCERLLKNKKKMKLLKTKNKKKTRTKDLLLSVFFVTQTTMITHKKIVADWLLDHCIIL